MEKRWKQFQTIRFDGASSAAVECWLTAMVAYLPHDAMESTVATPCNPVFFFPSDTVQVGTQGVKTGGTGPCFGCA